MQDTKQLGKITNRFRLAHCHPQKILSAENKNVWVLIDFNNELNDILIKY
jgi:hypothetical protein